MTNSVARKRKNTTYSDLFDLIDQADTIIVKNLSSPNSSILFESNSKKDIIALQETLASCLDKPNPFYSHCMCLGTPTIYLYDRRRGNKELLYIVNHHSKSVRCSLYASDLPLINQDKWLKWFDDREIPNPRQEVIRIATRVEKEAQGYRKWIAAMPQYLKAGWKKNENSIHFDGKCPQDLKHSIHKHLSGKTIKGKIMDILIWYGSTGQQWSGYPIYERVVEELLLDFDPNDIIEAVLAYNNRAKIDPRLLKGTAKLFTGFRFQKKYSDGLDLREELWEELQKLDLPNDANLLQNSTQATYY